MTEVDTRSFNGLVFIIYQFYKLANCFMGLQWVSQVLIKIDSITIPASLFRDTRDTSLYEPCNDSLHCTFGDSNLVGNLPGGWLWIVCQANKYMCVVTEKGPAFRFC